MRQQAIVGAVVLVGILRGTALGQGHAGVMMLEQGQPATLPAPFPAPVVDFKIGMLAVEPFEMGEPIENAPYSAEIINEVTQDLPDGNRIERRSTGTVARDSRGRVRREHQLAAIGPVVPDGDARMVTISDPVAGVHYSLDPVRKTAIRSRPPRVRTMIAGHAVAGHAVAGHAAIGGDAGPMMVDKHIESGVGLKVHREPETQDARIEQLGTKEYEGVRAEGTKTIATVPAGAIGNIRAIEIVSERWYSPELGVVVFSRRTDPRFGETTYRLANVIRAEPDASLFQVPADYRQESLKPLPFEPPDPPDGLKPY